jgi:hypothetical protein
MGWSSALDTLNEVQMRFPTLDKAVAFAEKHGLNYTIIAPHTPTLKRKSYADNFRYDRIVTWPSPEPGLAATPPVSLHWGVT